MNKSEMKIPSKVFKEKYQHIVDEYKEARKNHRYDRCRVVNCPNTGINIKNKRYFSFPQDMQRCEAWIKFSGSQQLLKNPHLRKYFRICEDHFENHCFMNPLARNRLTQVAIPTLLPPEDIEDTTDTETTPGKKVIIRIEPNLNDHRGMMQQEKDDGNIEAFLSEIEDVGNFTYYPNRRTVEEEYERIKTREQIEKEVLDSYIVQAPPVHPPVIVLRPITPPPPQPSPVMIEYQHSEEEAPNYITSEQVKLDSGEMANIIIINEEDGTIIEQHQVYEEAYEVADNEVETIEIPVDFEASEEQAQVNVVQPAIALDIIKNHLSVMGNLTEENKEYVTRLLQAIQSSDGVEITQQQQ